MTPKEPEVSGDEYSEEIRTEIALCLADLEPGTWGEVGLCPGPYGCLYPTLEDAIAAGADRDFCPDCRVIHVYRAKN